MSRLKNETEDIICMHSRFLSDLYHPEDHLGTDLRILRKQIERELQPHLEKLKYDWNLTDNPRAGAAELIECIKALDGDKSAHPIASQRWMT